MSRSSFRALIPRKWSPRALFRRWGSLTSIRSQLRLTFASSISLLLIACSVTIWLWGRYLAGRQIQALLAHDAERLGAAINWDPDLRAFELHPSAVDLEREFTSDWWQVLDPDGQVIWNSTKWEHPAPPLPADQGRTVFQLNVEGQRLFAITRTVKRGRSGESHTMLKDFPPAVVQAFGRLIPGGELIGADVEFKDDRLTYEVTARRGEDVYEIEMDSQGEVIQQAVHRVPQALPPPVLRTLQASGQTVHSFDWRAAQGRLQFLINARSAAGKPLRRCIDSTGRPVPMYFPPAETPGEAAFRLVIADDEPWRDELLRRMALLLGTVCGAGLAAALLMSVWLTRRTLLPIGAIARKAAQIDDRRLSERLSGGRANDEIGWLVAAINGMLDRIENGFERQSRFARDASHELRGPLTGLIAQLELARRQLPAGSPVAAHLDRALERGQRLRDLIDKLLLLARQDSEQPISMRDDVDLPECLALVVAGFPDEQRARITVRAAPAAASELLVRGNEELLHAMFRNIIDNALKFSPRRTTVEIDVEQRTDSILVVVCDRGPGIPASGRQRVFEPFVRLRPADVGADGSGLGLSIVKWIAALHRADIDVQPGRDGKGTRFCITLPTAECPAQQRIGAYQR